MTSSEKILAGITGEAEKKADEIIEEAKRNADKYTSEKQAEAEQNAKMIIDAANKKAQIIKSTGRSSAALLKRDAALSKRRTLIEKALDETVDSINAYDDDKYFAYLLKLISKGVQQGKGVLLLSKRDLSRNTIGFSAKLADYNLVIGENPAEINGGFILKYNDILINCEIKALIREKREQLVDSLNSTLFN